MTGSAAQESDRISYGKRKIVGASLIQSILLHMVRSVGPVGVLRGRSVPVGVGRLDVVLLGLLHLRVGGDDVGGAEVHPDGRVGLEAPLGATLVDVAPVRHLHLDYVLDLLQLLLLKKV